MAKCPGCGASRSWRLSDGRRKCRSCGRRFRLRTAWQASRLSDAAKRELVQRFAWGNAPPVPEQAIQEAKLTTEALKGDGNTH